MSSRKLAASRTTSADEIFANPTLKTESDRGLADYQRLHEKEDPTRQDLLMMIKGFFPMIDRNEGIDRPVRPVCLLASGR